MGLAKIAGVSREKCEEAIAKFEGPDPDSRSTEFNGKKIEKREGGWYILNGESYSRKMSADERREYQRIKQAEYRKRRKDAACDGAREAIDHGLKNAAASSNGLSPVAQAELDRYNRDRGLP
jgi:hypothetical protein